MQGECVQYRVAASTGMPARAAKVMAPISAWAVFVHGVCSLQVSGVQCGNPLGAPAYPVAITRPCLAITAPTRSLRHVDRKEVRCAMAISHSSRESLIGTP